MRKQRNFFLLASTLIAFAGIGYGFYIWNKPPRDVTSESAIHITAVAIYDSFTNNERTANVTYLNKAIEVSGKVISVKRNQAGKTVVYLQSNDPVFGVNCTFKQDPGTIHKGDNIIFKGICTGYLSDVILNQGILITNAQ